MLSVHGFKAFARVGATTPFISYEAEDGTLGGGAEIIYLTNPPTTRFSSPVLEASGHSYVQLTAIGQYVQWTNTTGGNITAINLRSCIPDAPAGGGISNTIDLYVNGHFRQAFSVNSFQNYCYEGTNYNGQTDKNPADGDPRGFWNDTHAFVSGSPIAPGDTFSFQMDSSNTAAFYYLDVVDVENPPPPLAQPANSLSITDYGAISNNINVDNTTAINNCFSAALQQGKIAWIPPGTFYISAIHGGLNASGITIAGAEPWYSTIYRVTPANNSQGVANIITTTSCTLSNVLLDCNGVDRAGNNNNGAINFSGNNWVVNNVWIQHVTSAFWCAGVNGIAENCRVLSVWSDGGNFNNVQSANGIGMDLTYSNNFVRGTGDDAMAINSVNYNIFGSTTNYYTMMSNIRYVNNTAIAPWGGKCMGIYGGINDVVTNNLLRDTARYIGLGVGKFGVNGSDLLSATVIGNTVLRCGGNGYDQQQQALMIGNSGDGQGVGAVLNAYCARNLIMDSLYGGVGFSTSSNIVFQYNTIIHPGFEGMIIGPSYAGSGVFGNAVIYSNIVTELNPGYAELTNNVTGYSAIIPIAATNYDSMSGVTVENCAEGGFDVTGTQSGDWIAYNDIGLDTINTFVARTSSGNYGGNIEIHLDSPTGTLVGTCAVSETGGWQTYANSYCNIMPTNGVHTIYLVFTGGSGNLLNLEYFGFYSAAPALSYQLIPGNTYSLTALANGKYVNADSNDSDILIAEGSSAGATEQFQIVDAGGGNIAFQCVANDDYVSADSNIGSQLVANRTAVGSWETFQEVDAGNGNIALRAMVNGKYVSVDANHSNALIAESTNIGVNESFAVEFISGVPPATPADLTATAGDSQATLNWIASTGATAYNVKRSTNSGGPYTVVADNVTGLSYTDTGLTNGATYYYVVSAQGLSGESDNSAEANVVAGSINRITWTASASSTESGGSPDNALDGNLNTRWSTGAQQTPGQWFEVDMGTTNTFYEIILNAASSSSDYPRGYQVTVSDDGINWSSPIATGAGTSALTTITFATQTARYLRVTQTGSASGLWWSIHEFNVLGTAWNPPDLSPPQLNFSESNGRIQITWPQNHIGWSLQMQTNSLTGTNWVTVPISTLTNQMEFPINPANGSIFFRLVYPQNN